MIKNTTITNIAETKIKPAKKRYMLFIKLVLSFIVISVIIIYAKNWDSSQKINKIKVTGTNLIDSGEITNLIQRNVINQPKGSIDFSDIKRVIDSHPMVASSSIVQTSFGDLDIIIHEKIPLALVRDYDNGFSYVDCTGNIIKFKLLPELSNLPLITCANNKNKINKTALEEALHILSEINNNHDCKNFSPFLSEIKYNPINKSYMLLIAKNLNINFGRNCQVVEKLGKLNRFLKYNTDYIKDPKNRIIDLRWENQLIISNGT